VRGRRHGALALTLVLLAASHARAATDTLEPYRRFVTTSDAMRLVPIARAAMQRHWSGAPADSSPAAIEWPAAPVPVYLTLRDGKDTRACVGAPAGAHGSLGATIEALALDALASDRRHPPVRQSELAPLRVVIAFTDEGVPVPSPMLVDPGREGLLIESPRGHVAFLPGEARTVRWALDQARRAGVIDPHANDATYRRLEVVTILEPEGRAPRQDDADADTLETAQP